MYHEVKFISHKKCLLPVHLWSTTIHIMYYALSWCLICFVLLAAYQFFTCVIFNNVVSQFAVKITFFCNTLLCNFSTFRYRDLTLYVMMQDFDNLWIIQGFFAFSKTWRKQYLVKALMLSFWIISIKLCFCNLKITWVFSHWLLLFPYSIKWNSRIEIR